MLTVSIIAGLIAIISLYDFFQTRNWQQITSDDRNETVFENRNKAYGAFAMRRDYNKHLLLVVAGVVCGAGILYATTRGKKYKQPELARKEVVQVLELVNNETPPKEEIFDTKPQHQQDEALAEATRFREMTVVDDPTRNPADVPEDGKNSSNEKREGEGGLNDLDKGNPEPPGPPTPPEPPYVEPKEPVIADEPATFPGGMSKLPPYLLDNLVYPQIAIELGLEGKCYTKFVVSKTGEISNVTVERGVPDCKECDKEAVRVIKGMPRWTPGKFNGRVVNSYFHLPIAFKLAK